MAAKPNILFVMTDQQRFDTIAAMGNEQIYTPNLDRLCSRGVRFTRAYSTCPVCVPARYTIRTGREPDTTGNYDNGAADLVAGQDPAVETRCGPYLAQSLGTLGYRTFGIGKFHTSPRYEDLGYEVHLHTAETYESEANRQRDAYRSFIRREHPEFDFIHQVHGERTEMYYMPQTSPMPAALTVEAFVADRAIEQIGADDGRPFFGMVSFVGPHPPLAPPIPFNRMYDPDRMPGPICGDLEQDHLDPMLPWMNHAIWAEEMGRPRARLLKARYYGEISYIDHCLGRILDAVDARGDADNTLIVFLSDHGDHMGDHHAWQKESFFEASCHVPMLASWPARLAADVACDELVCLTDLFAIATGAAGQTDTRDGIDILGMVAGHSPPRQWLFGLYGRPDTRMFKIMAMHERWKYIFIANGGREQLFDLSTDPNEQVNLVETKPDVASRMRTAATERLARPNADRALAGEGLRSLPFEELPLRRIYQLEAMDKFPDHPSDRLQQFQHQIDGAPPP